ncbi:hypothetical protein [Kitasatospora cinereorecta]|uniref:Acyl carrier protein n=1 Tax=Kitasatospora cinereorecta TaxID=285560 RepID=A0ABW0VHN8_9ACTN
MTTEPLTGEQVAAVAAEFALDEELLDELVISLLDESAAADVNDGAYPDLPFWDAHDLVHDLAGRRASDINNAGMTSQLAFIASCCSAAARGPPRRRRRVARADRPADARPHRTLQKGSYGCSVRLAPAPAGFPFRPAYGRPNLETSND